MAFFCDVGVFVIGLAESDLCHFFLIQSFLYNVFYIFKLESPSFQFTNSYYLISHFSILLFYALVVHILIHHYLHFWETAVCKILCTHWIIYFHREFHSYMVRVFCMTDDSVCTWFSWFSLLMLQLLRPNSSNLPCLYSTFHLEYPLVLSRFCLLLNVQSWNFTQLLFKYITTILFNDSTWYAVFTSSHANYCTFCQYLAEICCAFSLWFLEMYCLYEKALPIQPPSQIIRWTCACGENGGILQQIQREIKFKICHKQ